MPNEPLKPGDRVRLNDAAPTCYVGQAGHLTENFYPGGGYVRLDSMAVIFARAVWLDPEARGLRVGDRVRVNGDSCAAMGGKTGVITAAGWLPDSWHVTLDLTGTCWQFARYTLTRIDPPPEPTEPKLTLREARAMALRELALGISERIPQPEALIGIPQPDGGVWTQPESEAKPSEALGLSLERLMELKSFHESENCLTSEDIDDLFEEIERLRVELTAFVMPENAECVKSKGEACGYDAVVEVERLRAEIERLKTERDEALRDVDRLTRLAATYAGYLDAAVKP